MSGEIYPLEPHVKQRLDAGFAAAFGGSPARYYSAPGRTEIGGNHTDHQRGRVLAAAVNLHTVAAVRPNGSNTICVCSEGYPLCRVDLSCLTPVTSEINSTPALVRGVAARFAELGVSVGGFDAYCESSVLPGSGLSSSAAFEVLMAAVINGLFNDGKTEASELARIGQYAENVFFAKPCGLMDQTASAMGNLVAIDFFDREGPVIHPVAFDFAACGHALCIIDTHASHAELTDEYAAVPGEMRAVAAFFAAEVLSEVPEGDFYAAVPQLRQVCGDRAVLRAMHFYQENARVSRQVEALENGDFDEFLRLVRASGHSSFMYLQNVIPSGARIRQEVAVALALCERLLAGRGAYRVHGGGFAGTVQAFVPEDLLESFRDGMDAVLGEGSCHILSVRTQGSVEAM